MDDEQKKLAEKLFNSLSLLLAEHGKVVPLYFVVKDGQLTPLIVKSEVSMQQFATITMNYANEIDAEAVILACEQLMLRLPKNDENIQRILDGEIKPSDEKTSEPYLTLTYTERDGNTKSILAKIITSANGVRYTTDFEWINDTVTNLISAW